MPITITWMHAKRVIHQRYHGNVTGKQVADAIQEVQTLVRQGDAPVHIFVDSSDQSTHVDLALGDLKNLVPKTLDEIGWTVILQPHAIQRFFTSLGMQLSGSKYKFVKSAEEAMQFLVEHDPTLHDVIR